MTYYYAGLEYSSIDLAHHGIKGQKWGIRRYQNPDGTLTDIGRKRYGVYGQDSKHSYPLGTQKNNGIIRRALTGDYAGASGILGLGAQRHRDKREARLEKKAEKARQEGNVRKTEKYEKRYEAQKAKNIDLEKYMSKTGTGKIFIQNYLMTPYIADAYRAGRARGNARASSFIEAILPRLNFNPLNNESILAKYRDKKTYGALAHAEEE